MEIHDLIKQEFLNEWNSLTHKDINPYLKNVEDTFYIYSMRKSINESIDTSRDKTLMERYHRNSVGILARLYAKTLYEVSNNGQNINAQTIAEAKSEMKGKKECDAYPC
jgi:hypothetical protein